MLGDTPYNYINWINKDESWGGSVELLILAQHYKCEIVAIDVVNIRYDVFGEVIILYILNQFHLK